MILSQPIPVADGDEGIRFGSSGSPRSLGVSEPSANRSEGNRGGQAKLPDAAKPRGIQYKPHTAGYAFEGNLSDDEDSTRRMLGARQVQKLCNHNFVAFSALQRVYLPSYVQPATFQPSAVKLENHPPEAKRKGDIEGALDDEVEII